MVTSCLLPTVFLPSLCSGQTGEGVNKSSQGIRSLCTDCHRQEAESLPRTGHENVRCEMCHGEVSRHLENPQAKDTLVKFSELNVRKSQAVCLACHKDKEKDMEADFSQTHRSHESLRCFECHAVHLTQEDSEGSVRNFEKKSQAVDCTKCHQSLASDFESSSHGRASLRCLECHTEHETKNNSESMDEELSRCIHCHPNQELEFKSAFPHPLRDRQVRCSDCHDPHRDGPKAMLRKEGDRLCGDCHGDILIEAGRHPVSRGTRHAFGAVHCMDCHEHHGSNYEKVLKYSPEQICETCHHAVSDAGGF